jgi:hypothetical protein
MSAERQLETTPGCGVAIAADARGRHYFVSLDGGEYRSVPCFPATSAEARRLFGDAPEGDASRLQLAVSYGQDVAFVALPS